MTIQDLIASTLEASSGNTAKFVVALKRVTPDRSRAIVMVQWQNEPSLADIQESRLYIGLVQGFEERGFSRDVEAGAHFLANGSLGNPRFN